MTSPHPAPQPRRESPKTLTKRLKDERAGARGARTDLVPDSSGGDPILYEVTEER